ncbi:hypothetical protein P691DRAFT_629482, partial [Macrolepiota fuliginosa MF-IS2]
QLWRCWIVWNKSFPVIIIPSIGWLGNITCTIYAVYLQAVLQSGSRMRAGDLFSVLGTFWGSTILVNTYSSFMILWRICMVERAWRPPSICSLQDIPQRGRLQLVKRTIMESGLMYAAITIIVFISHMCRSDAIFITTAAEIQISGIAFNLILMRV